MNVVDSSAWLEYFADTDRADLFAAQIEDSERLVVPSISIYEVYKKVCRERGKDMATQIFSLMSLGHVIDLDSSLALEAIQHSLPLADSIATLSDALDTRWALQRYSRRSLFPEMNHPPQRRACTRHSVSCAPSAGGCATLGLGIIKSLNTV